MRYTVTTKKYVRTLNDLGFYYEVGSRGKSIKRGGTSHKVFVNGTGIRISTVVVGKETNLATLKYTGYVLEKHKIIGKTEFVNRVMR